MSSSVRCCAVGDGITNSGPGENLLDIYLLEETWSKMTEGQGCDEGLARLCADGLLGRGGFEVGIWRRCWRTNDLSREKEAVQGKRIRGPPANGKMVLAKTTSAVS